MSERGLSQRCKMQQFTHMKKLITQLSVRQERYTKMRDQMLAARPISKPKLDQALAYEHVTARLAELERVIEALVDTINLEQVQLDQRKEARRRKDRREQLQITKAE